MSGPMRVLTVRQPWAWAIIHGGKDIENRIRNIAGEYRGPVAIHVALNLDYEAVSPLDIRVAHVVGELARAGIREPRAMVPDLISHPDEHRHHVSPWYGNRGAIIGVVNLADVHPETECWNGNPCSPWAMGRYHFALENPRPLVRPIPYKGALGLRKMAADFEALVWAQVTS